MSEQDAPAQAFGIAKVFEAMKKLVADNVRAAGQEVPSQELGAAELATASSPPAIVWVLKGGPVTPARQAGADRRLGIREVAERHERVLVHVWAEDFGGVDALMNHFVAAMRVGLSGYSFQAISTDWINPEQAAKTGLGRLCVLEIEIRMPFVFEPIGISAPPHTLNLTGNLNAPQ